MSDNDKAEAVNQNHNIPVTQMKSVENNHYDIPSSQLAATKSCVECAEYGTEPDYYHVHDVQEEDTEDAYHYQKNYAEHVHYRAGGH